MAETPAALGDARLRELLTAGEVIPFSGYGDKVRLESKTGGFVFARSLDVRKISHYLTPIDDLIVRSHLPHPVDVDESEWRLSLEGDFEQSVVLTMADLKSFERVSKAVNIECTGNSVTRTAMLKEMRWTAKFFYLRNMGNWKTIGKFLTGARNHGMVSNAVFTGVRLRDVLAEYPLAERAERLVFQGADYGVHYSYKSRDRGRHHYARSFTVEDVRRYDPLLCFEMNGEPLRPLHGYPLRVVFPGVYGAEYVKWLDKIIAIRGEFDGYFQRHYYNNRVEVVENGKTTTALKPVHEKRPKSLVIRVVRRDGAVTVFGVAWGGRPEKMEVSVDGGSTWEPAELLGNVDPHAWTFWCYTLGPQSRGRVRLLPRLTNTDGRTQPVSIPKYHHYGNNSIVPIQFQC